MEVSVILPKGGVSICWWDKISQMIFCNENEIMGRAGGKVSTEPESSAEFDPAQQFRANVNLEKFV